MDSLFSNLDRCTAICLRRCRGGGLFLLISFLEIRSLFKQPCVIILLLFIIIIIIIISELRCRSGARALTTATADTRKFIALRRANRGNPRQLLLRRGANQNDFFRSNGDHKATSRRVTTRSLTFSKFFNELDLGQADET